VTVDGDRQETEAMLVAVANGPAFGGGMRLAPDASYDDGLLDVVILHRVSRAEFLRVFPQVFKGTHVTHPRVQVLRGRTVRLEAPHIVTQADGERFEPLPLDLEVVPGALTVVT
jgi:diacylglycerol kinase (ATP)